MALGKWGIGAFPFLFGRAFIEACDPAVPRWGYYIRFPFLFGRAFIEAAYRVEFSARNSTFPFLFGRAFIEACQAWRGAAEAIRDFPSFLEGLSLRLRGVGGPGEVHAAFPFLFGGTFIEAKTGGAFTTQQKISLPFRRDFH